MSQTYNPTSRSLSPRNSLFNRKVPFCGWLALVQSHLFPKLAGSNQKNYESHAGQVKRKVNCSKFSFEFNSVRIARHKERTFLKHAKSTWKNGFYPYAVFSTRAQGGASCQARTSRSLVSTRT